MKLLLLLPDGVGVRNFVNGPFLRKALVRGPLHALHVIPADLLGNYSDPKQESVRWHRFLDHQDRPLCFILRNCLAYSQGYWINNRPMRMRWKQSVNGSWRTKAALNMARVVGRSAASPRGIHMLDRLHTFVARRQPEVAYYRDLFTQFRPTVLFCSKQRSPPILAPVLAAQSLGIPTAAFIFSWYNLSSKGQIEAPFDHFLVWRQHMQEELLRYYPDVKAERVHIVGTPQFDPYSDPNLLLSREAFFQSIGADSNRPLICYSGGDCTNAVEDPQHVRILMQLIRSGQIKGRPQVLLRPSPIDEFSRYDAVRQDFPELIYKRPEWLDSSMREWAMSIPAPSDTQMLANLTHHASINVNFASTMTLDFAIRDKPVVNVAFDVTKPFPLGMPLYDYIEMFDHYRPVNQLGAARCAVSAEQLAEHVNSYLEDPSLDREGRRRFVELEVGVPVGASSNLVIETLEQISL